MRGGAPVTPIGAFVLPVLKLNGVMNVVHGSLAGKRSVRELDTDTASPQHATTTSVAGR